MRQHRRQRFVAHRIPPQDYIQHPGIGPVFVREIHPARRLRTGGLGPVRLVQQSVVPIAIVRFVGWLVAGPREQRCNGRGKASLLFIGGNPNSSSIVRSTLTVV